MAPEVLPKSFDQIKSDIDAADQAEWSHHLDDAVAEFQQASADLRALLEDNASDDVISMIVHCEQQTGVCYRLQHDFDHANDKFETAMDVADAITDPTRRQFMIGNILRDQGENWSEAGQPVKARTCLGEALRIFDIRDNPVETAITLGFWGRTQMKSGDIAGGVRSLKVADAILRVEDNRRIELYNKLLKARAEHLNQQPFRARITAAQALPLALRHGARELQISALLLIISGRLEQAIRNRRRSRR